MSAPELHEAVTEAPKAKAPVAKPEPPKAILPDPKDVVRRNLSRKQVETTLKSVPGGRVVSTPPKRRRPLPVGRGR